MINSHRTLTTFRDGSRGSSGADSPFCPVQQQSAYMRVELLPNCNTQLTAYKMSIG